MDTLLFYLFGGTALLAAILVVAQRRVFYSAVWLIVCLISLSALYLLLEAPFIAAIQVIVYAGAIMVLFLFVIMLLDPFSAEVLSDKKRSLRVVSVLLGTSALALLYSLLKAYDLARAPRNASITPTGTIQNIGRTLFSEYVVPFEVTSVLILVAIIGAVVLARRQA